jgi:hypothetical protein
MLYDWMKAADPATRVLSISRKDRGAILPIGKAKVPVFWYQSGIFTTSKYYADTLPTWLLAWNARGGVAKMAGRTWDLLNSADTYAEPDSQPWERGGNSFMMPKTLSTDTARVVFELLAVPWMDSLTADVALDGARALSLGKRENGTDLLSVSFSTTDAIGHVYGPDSREQHDQILRLDKWLGWFMDSLNVLVGGRPIVYALTADHGVTSFPEYLHSKGRMGGRARADSAVLQTWRALEPKFKTTFGIDFNNGLMLADVAAIKKAGLNFDSLASAVASKLANITGVTAVYTPTARCRGHRQRERDALAPQHSERLRLDCRGEPGAVLHLELQPRRYDPWQHQRGRRAGADRIHGCWDPRGEIQGGANRRHRAHARRLPRHQAARSGGGNSPARRDQVSVSVPHRALPCFPCPHASACCRFGTTVTDEEARAIEAAHGTGKVYRTRGGSGERG